MLQFISTNQKAESVAFFEALLTGLAPDKGLYIPTSFPSFPEGALERWSKASYAEIASEVLGLYTGDGISKEELQSLCQDAYSFEVPLEQVKDRQYVMRLDQGPTASFKDFAARAMARLMSHDLKRNARKLLILTATSGDTGSAIAHAFYQVPGIEVMVLFPKDEVSDRQRKQMTTLGGNIKTLAVEGKFDDCQDFVKRVFTDPKAAHLPLSSANSINIGRLLPQSVYYIYAYSRLATQPGEEITFCIPCGNFGNMMGAVLAKRMGLPIKEIIIAVNENDEVPTFLQSGAYEKIVPSKNCLSNAMNVGHPSNLARLVHVYQGEMDETGAIHKMPDLDAMRQDLYTVSITDQQTRDTIKEAYENEKLLLEPHGAVAWAGLKHYLQDKSDKGEPVSKDALIVSIETAHPAKFPDEIEKLLQFEPEAPESLLAVEKKQESYDVIPAEYEAFLKVLLG